MKLIQVLAYGPGFSPEPTFIGDDLAGMQAALEGLVVIDTFELDGERFRLVTLEDAKARGRAPNRFVGEQFVHGVLIITRGEPNAVGHWKFKSLTGKQVKQLIAYVDACNARPQAAPQGGEA